MKLIYSAISLALLLILTQVSIAEDISISASVDRKSVPVGDVITLTVQSKGSQAIKAPELPQIEGFQSRYLGPSTQLSIVNGRSSVSVEHRYYLIALRTGQFTIPSVSIKYGDRTYKTEPIDVQVIPGSAAQQRKAITPEELKKYIRLDILMKGKTAYINEGIPLTIRLYIRSGADVRDIQYPTFPSAGFSVLPFEKPIRRQKIVEGIRFTAIDFPTAVYPVTCGELTLGPAELDCNLMVTRPGSRSRTWDPLSDSLFDRRAKYSLTVKSEPYTITVNPLPTVGQPGSFSGAVGQYELDVAAKPISLKVGEPITLTMTVRGRGNIDMAGMPAIAGLTQFKVYDPKINVKKQGNTGEKTFEQVFIPRSADVKAIPEIQFSYFDPESGQYETLTRGPIPIQVAPSDESEPLQILEIAEGKTVRREILGKDIVYIKDDIGSVARGDGHLHDNKGFLILQLIPLIGFAGILVYQRRRERFATDRTYARQHQAPRKAKKGLIQAQKMIESGQSQEFCSTIFRTIQEYLGDRFDLPSAGITIEIVNSLRSQGIPEEILGKLVAFFQACDRIRFARSDMSKHEMKEILELATESIKLLEDVEVIA